MICYTITLCPFKFFSLILLKLSDSILQELNCITNIVKFKFTYSILCFFLGLSHCLIVLSVFFNRASSNRWLILLVLYLSSWWLLMLSSLIRSGIILRCWLVMLLLCLIWILILILIEMVVILWRWLVELLWLVLLLLDFFMLILTMNIIAIFLWH